MNAITSHHIILPTHASSPPSPLLLSLDMAFRKQTRNAISGDRRLPTGHYWWSRLCGLQGPRSGNAASDSMAATLLGMDAGEMPRGAARAGRGIGSLGGGMRIVPYVYMEWSILYSSIVRSEGDASEPVKVAYTYPIVP